MAPAWPVIAAILFLAALALRVPGAFSELWLDEVWSLRIAASLDSAGEIFTRVHHSNNHHLNTLWCFGLGPDQHWAVYRIPSLIAGATSVLLAARLLREPGAQRICTGLFLLSYPMIHYASEARGYAMWVVFSLAAYLFARGALEGRAGALTGLALCTALGFLSQLLFFQTWLAISGWLLFCAGQRSQGVREFAADATRLLAAPAAVALAAYLALVRPLEVGRGAPYEAIDVLLETLSYTAGGPHAGPLAWLAAVATLGLLGRGLVLLRRRDPAEALFYTLVVLVVPACILLVNQPAVLPLRWFLVSIAFAIAVMAVALDDLRRRGPGPAAWVAAALALYAAGNLAHLHGLLRDGRGGYREALRALAEEDPRPVLRVTSDQGFRTRLLLGYYERYLPDGRELVYHAPPFYDPPPEWRIVHRYRDRPEPEPQIRERGRDYRQVRRWPSSRLSGFRWYLYRSSASDRASRPKSAD